MSWAKRRRVGSAAAKLVLLVLADYASPGPDDGTDRPEGVMGRHYAWAGIEKVADACEMGERSVRRHEDTLAELGLIRKVRRVNKLGHRMADFIVLAVDDDGPRPFEEGAEIPRGQTGLEARSGLQANSDLQATSGQVAPEFSQESLAANCGRYIGTTSSTTSEELLRSSSAQDEPAPTALFAVPDTAPTGHPTEKPGVNSRELVAYWVDQHSRRPADRVVGQVARLIKELLEGDGFEPDAIKAGLDRMRTRKLGPSVLASLVTEAAEELVRPAPPQPVRSGWNQQPQYIGELPVWMR